MNGPMKPCLKQGCNELVRKDSIIHIPDFKRCEKPRVICYVEK